MQENRENLDIQHDVDQNRIEIEEIIATNEVTEGNFVTEIEKVIEVGGNVPEKVQEAKTGKTKGNRKRRHEVDASLVVEGKRVIKVKNP